MKGKVMTSDTLGLIGYGNMGSAILGGLASAKVIEPSAIHVFDIDSGKRGKAADAGFTVHDSIADMAESAATVILAVKPKDIETVAYELSRAGTVELVISIAAGISIAAIEKALGEKPVIRVMPNTPCMVGAGAIVLARGTFAGDQHIERAKELMGVTGVVTELSEADIDAVTGLSGSGPAYVAVMIDALADGGVKMGLPRPVAQMLAAQTVYGTAKMMVDRDIHPATLKEMVTSPGGTTIAGLAALEDGGFRATIMDAVEAAARRSKELGGV